MYLVIMCFRDFHIQTTGYGRQHTHWHGLVTNQSSGGVPAAVPKHRIQYAYDHQGRMVWKETVFDYLK